SVIPYANQYPKYERARILERMTEPDRIIIFRVCWADRDGNVRVNRGYRVQFNNAIGPYKGGLRFDRTVSLSILKFLGFEQTFKNSLTTLPMGSAKGGSDFNPRGKTDVEVMNFCQAFMTELSRYIGKDVDIPAGDIGVGAREISYLFGQYKRLSGEFAGILTGKGLSFGGSPVRIEATGYGCVYFAEEMLSTRGESLEGKRCAVSGAGNVAMYAACKLAAAGAKVVTLSDRGGFLHSPGGFTEEQLAHAMDYKASRRGDLAGLADEVAAEHHPDGKPWAVPCDIAFPCATQNELTQRDARRLLKNGCQTVCEGANMPSTNPAADAFRKAGILYGPGKAANAGGVATSGLEMTQNAMHLTWSREDVDRRLREIMASIHAQCVEHGQDGDGVDYVKGANIAGFIKVADAMLAHGMV
ncbi:NADP-specific glutamate dehydrogenase, partial [Candidatus Poribacteria bacterium]|nr:NADP-specific glutamate dehydrogenase [Candidatus Poribacteria bacterium]